MSDDELFDEANGLNTYAVLDGASIPRLMQVLDEMQPEHLCLFGEVDPELAAVAPYVVRLRRGDLFARWVIDNGRTKNSGIFALSKADLLPVAAHLRTLLVAELPDGKRVLFRFYDPRVLQVYLPTCTPAEYATFRGPLERVLA